MKILSLVVVVMLSLSLMACNNRSKSVKETEAENSQTVLVPTDTINLSALFIPSGYMGDGESGKKYIKYIGACTETPFSLPTCIKIQYIPGTVGWGGFYWQNKANNWGDKQAENYSAKKYTTIRFYAKGQNGGETIEFKSGGIDAGKKFKDSYEKSIGKITLEKGWKEYKINLKGLDLSSVIGGFCWVATSADNPTGATFFLDDIIMY